MQNHSMQLSITKQGTLKVGRARCEQVYRYALVLNSIRKAKIVYGSVISEIPQYAVLSLTLKVSNLMSINLWLTNHKYILCMWLAIQTCTYSYYVRI